MYGGKKKKLHKQESNQRISGYYIPIMSHRLVP